MARSENFYERFAKSVAPSIFGTLGASVPVIMICDIDFVRRYQESDYVPVIRWLEESPARWHATPWGYQRASPW
jgi:hypothetical protein